MRLYSRLCLLAMASAVVMRSDDPSWKQKTISEWDDHDARQVLAASPWAKSVKLTRVRDLSKFERRDGGNMEAGIPPDTGFISVNWMALASLFDPRTAALAKELAERLQPDLGSVTVRWESALPIREAESKASEVDAPALDANYYAIAIYDITPPFRWNLANELKGLAHLEREKQKDLKPARVEILERDKGLVTVVYLFPRSAGIMQKEHTLRFVAQIGRLFVSQFFFPGEMEFMGKQEL